MSEQKIKPGDLYKKITVAGREFEIYYMDCGEFDPESKGEVIPNFPFFDEQPEYTNDRYPFTNALNDCCEHYKTDDSTPEKTCRDCIYFKDRVEELGVCRCTARRLRGVGKPVTGKLMKVAVIGNLPTAEKVIADSYLNVQLDRYYRATDMAGLPPVYDLIIVESYAGEGLGLMELTVKYKANTYEEVTVPVKLLAEPTTGAVEDELSVFVKLIVAKKVNELSMDKPKDLLDILWERIGCDYLSDLKDEPYRTQVPHFIKDDEIENFPLKDYEEMVSYLYKDKRTFANYDDVLQYLSLLKRK